MKKAFIFLFSCGVIFLCCSISFAQELDLIEEEQAKDTRIQEEKSVEELKAELRPILESGQQDRGIIPIPGGGIMNAKNEDIGDKIRDGELNLNDLPFIIVYWINYLTRLAGVLCVLMVVYGGLKFVLSGVTEDKEGAKNTLTYALGGLVVTFLAWVLIAFIQLWLTR